MCVMIVACQPLSADVAEKCLSTTLPREASHVVTSRIPLNSHTANWASHKILGSEQLFELLIVLVMLLLEIGKSQARHASVRLFVASGAKRLRALRARHLPGSVKKAVWRNDYSGGTRSRWACHDSTIILTRFPQLRPELQKPFEQLRIGRTTNLVYGDSSAARCGRANKLILLNLSFANARLQIAPETLGTEHMITVQGDAPVNQTPLQAQWARKCGTASILPLLAKLCCTTRAVSSSTLRRLELLLPDKRSNHVHRQRFSTTC
mmetsp:Transcript_57323/g.153211  ORF Transcript_57323/g.153211 Transcript_57323/m.153211 type:complete len:265 (-) Transcript_57323:767-1561(-)